MNSGNSLQFESIPFPVAFTGVSIVELLPTPSTWEIAACLSHVPYFLFLDSAEMHPDRGRFSYLMADPIRVFRNRQDGSDSREILAHLETVLGENRRPTLPGLPPFQGGFAGLFGYGLSRSFEKIVEPRVDDFPTPDIVVGQFDWVISIDHHTRRCWAISWGSPEKMTWLLQTLRSPSRVTSRSHKRSHRHPANRFPLDGYPGVFSSFDRRGYEVAVARAIELIHAGDCFQVNLAQQLLAPLQSEPFELYGQLRSKNPAPFGAYYDAGDFQILSASPERFVSVFDGIVESRPIKGTRPRGQTEREDRQLKEELASNAKDRSENVMIVDLMRNDLGRVCEFGSVRVPIICEVESFRFVHHLVSEVHGRLRPGVGPIDLLRAAFPGGSVTGAPKIRAMEIIAELEPIARGPYCGSLGFIGYDGSMDLNILIRTMTASEGWVQFPVGAGIVADSNPAREYEETLHKAAGLLQSVSPLR